jgi:DNA-directed RNA polymerase specialized sigma24 family protein
MIMWSCAVTGCFQQTLREGLCYFHRKQALGIIEVSEYDEPAATPEEIEMFDKYQSLAKGVGTRFSSKSKIRGKSVSDCIQIGYLSLWKQIRSGNYKTIKHIVSYLQSICWNAMKDSYSWSKNVDTMSLDSMMVCTLESPEGACIRVETLKKIKRMSKKLDKLDREIFYKNIYPIVFQVQSLRAIARFNKVSHVMLSVRKLKLMRRFRKEVM